VCFSSVPWLWKSQSGSTIPNGKDLRLGMSPPLCRQLLAIPRSLPFPLVLECWGLGLLKPQVVLAELSCSGLFEFCL